MIKKSIISFFFIISIVFLSGCELLQNDLALFSETYNNMAESMNFEMELILDVEINGEVLVDESTTIYYDLESEEVGNMKVDLLGVPMTFELSGSNITSYFQLGTTWVKTSMTTEELGIDTSIETDDYSFLTDEDVDYTLVEETDSYNVYEFKINDSSFLTESIEGIEGDLLSQVNMTKEEFYDLFEEITLQITIDKEKKLITKMELDLTEMLNSAFNPDEEEPVTTTDSTTTITSPEATVEVDKFFISIEFKNFNGVDITITEEMKNAKSIIQ
jgi:hypothetical protein